MYAWQQLKTLAAPYRQAYQEALQAPAQTQAELLRAILHAQQDTEFGRRFGLGNVRNLADYQQRVPMHRYTDLEADIQRMAAGETGVLCASPVRLFEVTSGTASAAKLIPYTEASIESFRQAVLPWLSALMEEHPGIMDGSAYWSISPATRPQGRTLGGLPIGMHSDAAYFGAEAAEHISRTLAVPGSVGHIRAADSWRHTTLLHLARTPDLRLISVWSPTFLLELMTGFAEHAEQLVADIRVGGNSCGPATGLEAALPQRADDIVAALTPEGVDTTRLWPQLSLLSCWTDGASGPYAALLAQRFPHAPMQGKGLLATEAPVTLPWSGHSAPLPALNSAVFEFLDAGGEAHGIDNLTEGESYEVLLTTWGGLYRYRLGDRVRVEGFLGGTPRLRFLGRSATSDLCGEKLHEAFVTDCLSPIPGFSLLAPNGGEHPGYALYVDAEQISEALAPSLANEIEGLLAQNPQYRHARQMNQLQALHVYRTIRPLAVWQQVHLAKGASLGDIKAPSLALENRWHNRFEVLP